MFSSGLSKKAFLGLKVFVLGGSSAKSKMPKGFQFTGHVDVQRALCRCRFSEIGDAKVFGFHGSI